MQFVATLDQTLLQRADLCFSPLLEIVSLNISVDLSDVSNVIFTSANAVQFVENGRGRSAYCVGKRTAERAVESGWKVENISETADDLVAALSQNTSLGTVTHIAGVHRRGEIGQRLNAAGLKVRTQAVYDQRTLPLSDDAKAAIGGNSRVILPLFSPRTAAQLHLEAQKFSQLHVLAISSAVAEIVQDLPLGEVRIAQAPTALAMRMGVEKLLRENSLP
ncbi:MAG: uroporphyrinogen-III synthase [Sulfitobacter sp.]